MAKPSPSQRGMRRIADIKIGTRLRKDLGDIPAFARSINKVELLQPVVITPNDELVVGGRRLAALQHLGHEEIPVTIRDVDDILRAQLAENSERKGFLPSEINGVYRSLQEEERAKAKQRQVAAGPSKGKGKKNGPGILPEAVCGQVRDKIGALTGVSGRTVDKIVEVCEAAEAEPEKYAQLVIQMDRTGKVDGVYKKLKIQRQAEAILQEPPPLPGRGPYRVIAVDPPWPYGSDPYYRAGACPYPLMPIADICALPVADIAHRDSILFLWTTNAFLREAFQVVAAWGFSYKTMLTWAKDRMGLGDWLRGQTEHCLLAVRGNPTIVLGNHTTILHGPVRAHSQKPDEFYEFVQSYAPAARYAELFARTGRPGWDGHGDELKPLDDDSEGRSNADRMPSVAFGHDDAVKPKPRKRQRAEKADVEKGHRRPLL
jgi:ParB/RepB/Spo0J family partition protein